MRMASHLRMMFLALAGIAQAATAQSSSEPAAATEDVLIPVHGLFAGIEAADAKLIASHVRMGGGGVVTVVDRQADGSTRVRHFTWEENLSYVKAGERRYSERFFGRPQVAIEGDIAMVWGDFV